MYKYIYKYMYTCDEHDGRLPHAGIYFLPVHHVRVKPANPESVDRRERPLVPDVETVVQGTCFVAETTEGDETRGAPENVRAIGSTEAYRDAP